MDTKILLLGPSGIGKTTLLKYFTSKVKCVFGISMDNIAHKYARELELINAKDDLNQLIRVLDNDRDRLLAFGLEAIAAHQAKHAIQPTVIDVGTGFLDASSSMQWISQHPSITVFAEPAIAFDRFRKARRLDISYEQYVSTQFSKKRTAIYHQAGTILNTEDLDEATSAHRFACCLFGSLPPDVAAIALSEWLR